MPSVLITGSNRGLGLEWVRQYAAEGWKVYATCRYPEGAHELQEMARQEKGVSIHRLDITKAGDVHDISVELMNQPLDVLVNNAGVYMEKYKEIALGRMRYEDWLYTFRVNTLGAVRVTEALLDNVSRGKKKLAVVISTHMASVTDIEASGSYYYRSTKAALNAAMEGISRELKRRGIGLLLLHPGWVRTRMGGEGTSLMPAESVRGMRKLVEDFRIEQTGRFIRYDGVEMPW
ncbi:MAG: SDR family oxidoreductase [Deltaproteobacteria bacterium]|nr:SDR family oxidoreductase [Deltaproteobacteria bacterium]